jgi:hypothetical protein
LSTIGSNSFGIALVAGKNRVPNPATGNTAFLTFLSIDYFPIFQNITNSFQEYIPAELTHCLFC